MQAREIHLRRRPGPLAAAEDFETVEVELPALRHGEVRVENQFLSVDPYMRQRMVDAPSYYSPWPLGADLDGDALGVVVESAAPGLEPGRWVASQYGWRDGFVSGAQELTPLDMPPDGLGWSAYLGVFGATGLTAWLGVVDIILPRPGDVVLVTSAAGAVGSAAGQIARACGATVIGSTSSAAKAEIVTGRYGFDAAFNYRDERPADAIARLAPDGLDGYFDSVGGEHLEAALDAMRVGGRIAKCGGASAYDTETPPPGPSNLHQLFARRLLLQGYLVSDHRARVPEFRRHMRHLLDTGRVVADETVVDGLDAAVPAFLGLFHGANVGKTVVRL